MSLKSALGVLDHGQDITRSHIPRKLLQARSSLFIAAPLFKPLSVRRLSLTADGSQRIEIASQWLLVPATGKVRTMTYPRSTPANRSLPHLRYPMVERRIASKPQPNGLRQDLASPLTSRSTCALGTVLPASKDTSKFRQNTHPRIPTLLMIEET